MEANMEEKLSKIKKKLDKFSKKILDQFDKYIISIALLPPPNLDQEMKLDQNNAQEMKQKIDELKNKHNIVVVVDDSDSKEAESIELNKKINTIINKIGQEIDKDFSIQTILISELWQSCLEGRREFVDILAVSAVIYDKWLLNTLKVTNLHKYLVLQKFEKYIVSYVLSGSLVTGKANKKSDIDIWIIVDDTDVKRMPRYELKEKLSVIIHQMSFEAAEKTGVKTPINIQTYLLSDFWEGLRDANPIYFTLLRDGISLYDRGLFLPWKQLLKKGKIKPSKEAIEQLMHVGQGFLDRAENKLKEIAVEDFFWAIHSPSQAALMLMGLTPPAPSETVKLMEEIFVKKEKLLEKKYLDTLKNVLKIRKSIEHGEIKKVSGQEIQKLLNDSKEYLERIKLLYKEIENIKEKENITDLFDTTTSLTRDILKLSGIKKIKEEDILKTFEEELINTGQIKKNLFTKLKYIFENKNRTLTADIISKIKNNFSDLFKEFIDFIEKKKGKDLDQIKINVISKNKSGVINIFDQNIFILFLEDNKNQTVLKAKLNKNGGFDKTEKSNIEEYEKQVDSFQIKNKPKINKEFIESLEKLFGENTQIYFN
ncbi:hypothetical protein HOC99_00350 [Candidatus Woesearchaeota archaeon]|nr:hypothetical protein [Candidatus Woesearchaeota archaeon]MBT4387522.1 hypothetical protein [Candidatus Woesearchaeota archaeon]MBT4595364.1 hypothetical protein [Candidatus Woesearchaeota archaeon]MBT5741231.1 hypothetical protein [Candidatus Woesearchaeota archaeon]MBT7849630.1 hypothetical protein [Candidatus Woesearchaeota archaeon]